jgi:hypothetical protein
MLLFRTKKEFVGGCAILAKIIVFSKFSRLRFFTLMIFKFSKNEFYKIKPIQKDKDFTKENTADAA